MKIRSIPVLAPAAVLTWCALAAPAADSAPLNYPAARRGDQIDRYHGIAVADPYRWMEDIDSPETRHWVEAEAKLTSDYLAAIPGRDDIARRLKEIWNYERWSAPEKHGPNWLYTHNDGLQNQSVLFLTGDPQHRRSAAAGTCLVGSECPVQGRYRGAQGGGLQRRWPANGVRFVGSGFRLGGLACPRCGERQEPAG
jgi:hypothetical protein